MFVVHTLITMSTLESICHTVLSLLIFMYAEDKFRMFKSKQMFCYILWLLEICGELRNL